MKTDYGKLTLRILLALAAWYALYFAFAKTIPAGSLAMFRGVFLNPFFVLAASVFLVRRSVFTDMELRLEEERMRGGPQPAGSFLDPIAGDIPTLREYRQRFGRSDSLYWRYTWLGWLMIGFAAAAALFWVVHLPKPD